MESIEVLKTRNMGGGSSVNDENYVITLKQVLELTTLPPQMKLCPKCHTMFAVLGKRVGQKMECPFCHHKYALKQKVILKTILVPVEAV